MWDLLEERRLSETDNVFDTLDSLLHKQLPGIGDFSKVSRTLSSAGNTYSVRMNDDNIIKVIVNKKLNLYEKNYHLIRVFMFDESDSEGKLRTYKTIGVNSNMLVHEIVEICTKKFKLPLDGSYNYFLCSVFKGVG